jgi:hypothetical protein
MSSAEGIGYVAFSRPSDSESTEIRPGLGMGGVGLKRLIFMR